MLATSAANANAHSLLPTRSAFENGYVHTLVIVEHVLPMLALGLASGQLPWLGSALIGALFLASSTVGVLVVRAELSEIEWMLVAFAPCALFFGGGLPLLAIGWNAAAVLVVAAPVVGFLIGVSVAHEAWGRDEGTWFIAGALLAAVSIAIFAAMAWKRLRRPWFLVSSRIVGSWMLALGAILLAAGVQEFRHFKLLETSKAATPGAPSSQPETGSSSR